MAITQAMPTSFKVEILQSYHNFSAVNPARSATTADTFKIALYTSTATLGASTTSYSTTTNEVTGTGYTAGGEILTISTPPTFGGTVAYLSFSDKTWPNATITANGALIYNSSQGGRAVAVLAFGGDKTSTNGNFTVQFPTADSTNAIIRIS